MNKTAENSLYLIMMIVILASLILVQQVTHVDPTAIIVSVIAVCISALTFLWSRFDKYRDEHPTVHLIIQHWGNGTFGIVAQYKKGKVPITLHQPVVIFEKNGLQSFGLSDESLNPISPDSPKIEYNLGAHPFPGDTIKGVSLEDFSGRIYYSLLYPKKYRLSVWKKIFYGVKFRLSLRKEIKS
jgi:hypothetical protein